MIDILAIGAHPDDIELSCAGTLLKQKEQGSAIALLDLTKGELGTRGNGPLRLKEAEKAAQILGIESRINLNFKDGFFGIDEDHIRSLVEEIRDKKPRIILCNALEDRHPDHGRGAELVKQACFYSGLVKFETKRNGKVQEVWRPDSIFNYIQFKYIRPDFLVDITPYFEKKMESIRAYESQFYNPESDEPETTISSESFLEFIEARAKEFGRIIGVKYAEGFNVQRIPAIDDLNQLK